MKQKRVATVQKKRRIFMRTALMCWTLVLLTSLVFLAVTLPSQREQLLDEMRQRAKVVFTSTAQMAVESIVLEDYSTIVEYCINMVNKTPSLKYVVLTRQDGYSLVHTRSGWQQTELGGLWRPNNMKGDLSGRFVTHEISDGEVFHLIFPLVYSGIEWGWIHLGLAPDKFYEDLRDLYSRTMMVALAAIFGGLVASFVYARRLSIPIQRLEGFAQQIAAGDLSQRIDIRTGDEVQTLAESFNNMVDELDRSHLEIVKAARQAGMAEMSVNVLHNVGNVLNSVGVTTQALKRRLRESKMLGLKPLVEMLEAHEGRLADFIGNDLRGKKIPAYLTALNDHLHDDHQFLNKDLTALERHIQHIQDIVLLQQNYSRTVGLTELVDVSEVIEDALQLYKDSIKRHRIEVQKHMESVPKTVLDRHKLLQILINLISNAKQAFQSVNGGIKRIEIRLGRPTPQMLRITVADNGMGISQENLTRIFQHGFTTRKNGHGFGLHSSALAASEMNGSLRVDSPGPGQGAVFTLDLPIREMERSDEAQ